MAAFEIGMLICFGASWPFSIAKVLKAKSSEGKSFIFLWLLLLGYVFGILFKISGNCDWVLGFYLMNGTMVFTDLMLSYKYKKKKTT